MLYNNLCKHSYVFYIFYIPVISLLLIGFNLVMSYYIVCEHFIWNEKYFIRTFWSYYDNEKLEYLD
jgi:hypothetical protein